MQNRGSNNYDVIIIGAGSIGAPTALSIARAGLKTLVLDPLPSVGQGSNKRAIGGIRATHSDPAKIRLCRRSLEIFSSWQEVYGDDIEWYQGGYLFAAYRDQEMKALKDLLVIQQSFGLPIEWLDAESLREITPDLNPEGLLGGTWSPEDGNASPLLAIHAFYRHAKEYGAEFHFNEPVTAMDMRSGRIHSVQTREAKYTAGVVINAAGPWAADVGRLIGMDIPVRSDSHEAAITEPVARFLEPMVVDIRPTAGSANYYFYQHLTGQIVFCITPRPSIWGEGVEETSDFLPMVARRMIEIMPRLKNIRVRRTWRGLYPMTPDGFPLVGWAQEARNFMLAAGMCGQGFMLGPALGELLARTLTGDLQPHDHEILQILDPYRSFIGQEVLK